MVCRCPVIATGGLKHSPLQLLVNLRKTRISVQLPTVRTTYTLDVASRMEEVGIWNPSAKVGMVGAVKEGI